MGEEGEAPGVYSFIKEDGGDAPTSRGYTGKGKANYPNGDKYEGDYVDGQRQGSGTYEYANGDVFEGEFKDNLKTGKGKFTYADGGFYHGFFKDGRREGEGTFRYKNGDIYSGYWAAGLKHGDGTYVYNTTKYKLAGKWKKGQLTTGQWILTNGNTYTGTFYQQKPKGDGVWNCAGTAVEGSYQQQSVPLDEAADDHTQKPATKTNVFWTRHQMAAAA